jgi:hypothetical protein
MRITNKEIHDILQWTDVVKFIKSARLKWYGQTERTNNKRRPKTHSNCQNERNKERRMMTEEMD